jgi:Ca2+-binding EF-hand superfamily protein
MRNFYPEKRIEFVYEFYEPAEDFPEFTRDEIDVFVQTFREFDANGDGHIDCDELDKGFKFMGQRVSKEQLKQIIDAVDDDKSGAVEWPEFLKIMRMMYPHKRIEFERKFYVPALDYPEFTRDEIDVFIKAFRQFDLDGNGCIDADELTTALKYMGMKATPQVAQEIIKAVDKDGSGTVEWPEYLEIMRTFYPEKRRQFIRDFYEPAKKFPEFTKDEINVFVQTFRRFDLDGSNSIDANELGIALKFMGMGSSPKIVQQIIDEVDADKSGEIEWPEFLVIMRNFYPERRAEFEKEFYGAAKNFPEFDKEDIDAFIEAFREFDIDGSGSIDLNELEIGLKYMGQGFTRDQLQRIISEVDSDGSGEIEWPEFLEVMRRFYSGKLAPGSGAAASPAKGAATTPAKGGPAPTQTKTAGPTPTSPSANRAGPAPTPSNTSAAPKPATTGGFTPAKPATTSPAANKPTPLSASAPASSGAGVQVGGQRGAGSTKCVVCGKTVYPIEAVSAMDQVWHKGCFKCQGEGCGLTLNLKNFTGVEGKVYCKNHVPKLKPTQVTMEGTLVGASIANAPKLAKVQGIQKNARTTFAPGQLNPVNPDQQ